MDKHSIEKAKQVEQHRFTCFIFIATFVIMVLTLFAIACVLVPAIRNMYH